MFEKLASHIDVLFFAKQARVISFRLSPDDLPRLAQSTQGVCTAAQGKLSFSLFNQQWPQIELSVRVDVKLICQRTLNEFVHSIDLHQFLVFAGDDDDVWLETQEILAPEDMNENPRVWIEDGLLLALPLVPVQLDSEPVDYQVGVIEEEKVEKPNPFMALKAMMQKE